jgi:hypothetical protein
MSDDYAGVIIIGSSLAVLFIWVWWLSRFWPDEEDGE